MAIDDRLRMLARQSFRFVIVLTVHGPVRVHYYILIDRWFFVWAPDLTRPAPRQEKPATEAGRTAVAGRRRDDR